jgi:hypothetical protein
MMKALLIGLMVFCVFIVVLRVSIKLIYWVNSNEYGGLAFLIIGTLIVSWLMGKTILKIIEER